MSITGTSTTSFRRFVDADGNRIRTQQSVSAPADVVVNLDTGKTVTVRGFRYLGTDPGSGVAIKDAGRILFADETEERVLFRAGRRDTATPDLLGPALCGAVA